ncbi:MAG: hypothetical protein JRJ45_07975 [Deltaproteobacteria bacterium]|nr:hypothetical protein [Deltaproteobacteria bacterium]
MHRRSNKKATIVSVISEVFAVTPTADGIGMNIRLFDPIINGKQILYKEGVYHQCTSRQNSACEKLDGVIIQNGHKAFGPDFIQKGYTITAPAVKYTVKKWVTEDGKKAVTHSYFLNDPNEFDFTSPMRRDRTVPIDAPSSNRRPRK